MFWPFTVWINCSSDFKKFANSQPAASNFKSFSQSPKQFFLTVGQNNFGNKLPFIYQSIAIGDCFSFWKCSKILWKFCWKKWKWSFGKKSNPLYRGIIPCMNKKMAMLLLTFLHINILCEKILYSNYYSWEFFYCCKLLISQPSGPNGWGVERRILYEAKYEELSINSALHQSGQGVRLKRFMPSISLGILNRWFSFEL